MVLSMCALPNTLSTGLRWLPKKGPMINTTAAVAPKYFRKKSCRHKPK